MDDGAAFPADTDVDGGSMIPNLGGLPIEEVLGGDHSVLDVALSRFVREVGVRTESYAAHSSSS